MTIDRRATPRIRRRDAEDDEARRVARREAFLEAAVTVIRRDGPDASMEVIAREAGVTKPILYRVFGAREGLLTALGQRFAAELASELDPVLSADDDTRTTLTRGIRAYIDLVDRDLDIYRFLTATMSTELHGSTGGFVQQVAHTISDAMGKRLRIGEPDAGVVESGVVEPWAYGLVGMVHMAGDWWIERRTIPKERLVEYLVTLLWEGLGSTATEGSRSRPSADDT
jgi:AcrR family transcriptional regulator